MAHLSSHPYPPHHHLTPRTPLPASAVLPLIQDYLTKTTTSPHLHPDCIFIEREGPAFSGNAGIGGVVLHQLRRVEAGLRGIWLGGIADELGGAGFAGIEEEPAGGQVEEDGIPKSNDNRLDAMISEYEARGDRIETGAGTAEELGNYQEQLRDQGERDEWGEIGGRSNAVRNRVTAPEVQSTSKKTPGNKRERVQDSGNVGDSKAARKKAKKERGKDYKAKKASERMAKADEDSDAERRESVDKEPAKGSEELHVPDGTTAMNGEKEVGTSNGIEMEDRETREELEQKKARKADKRARKEEKQRRKTTH